MYAAWTLARTGKYKVLARRSSSNAWFTQTQTLPENDEHSVSFKQFSAMLDVSMGGRIVEEMSKRWYFEKPDS